MKSVIPALSAILAALLLLWTVVFLVVGRRLRRRRGSGSRLGDPIAPDDLVERWRAEGKR